MHGAWSVVFILIKTAEVYYQGLRDYDTKRKVSVMLRCSDYVTLGLNITTDIPY